MAKQEKANISCQVDANPPEVQFRWTFNNSAESIDVAASHIARSGTSSIVSYTPMTELDYGTLLCWATNRIGHQQVPCVYHIIPAGEVSLCGNSIMEIPLDRETRYIFEQRDARDFSCFVRCRSSPRFRRDSKEIGEFFTIALIFISRRQKFFFSVRSLRENCIEAKSNNRGFSRFESKFKHNISQDVNYYTDGGGQLI